MESNFNDELIERILLDLKSALKKDPLIDEFDILPVHKSLKNKSPVIHVSNKLALEDWCVTPLYVYVYNRFFAWKRKKFKVDSEILFTWTCAILLINPELETAWNTRKELLSNYPSSKLCQLTDELKFSEIVLSRKPKSSPVFAHRKWLLLRIRATTISRSEVIKQELYICSQMAERYANNYYAWSHRQWLIQEFLPNCLKIISEELTRTEFWVLSHVSDHSGFHYRQFLLSCYSSVKLRDDSKYFQNNCILHGSPTLLKIDNVSNCSSWTIKERMLEHSKAIHHEIIFLSELQFSYPGHETLWYHRRYLLREIKSPNVANGFGESCPTMKLESLDTSIQNKRHKYECDSKMMWNFSKEETFLHHCIKESSCISWERELLRRHLKWLDNELIWPMSISLS